MKYVLTLLLAILASGTTVVAQQTPSSHWSGLVYTDYFYNIARDTGAASLSQTALGGAKDLNGFKIRRVYLTFDHVLSSRFSFRFRFETDEAANSSNGKIGAFVKEAYVKWKQVFTGSDLTFGIQSPPAFDISEAAWGYRSIEKTIMDLRGIVSSRDQGISLHGNLVGDGSVRYWVMYGNNSANSPEADKYKRYYGHVEVHPLENLTATVYADLAARSPLRVGSQSMANNAMTYAGFVGYAVKGAYSVGVEGFLQSTDHGFLTAGSYVTKSAQGLSLFGSFALNPEYSVLGRFDLYDPNTNSAASGDSRNYLIAGLDWHPEPKISIIPNLMLETYESVAGRSITSAVTGRVTIYYSF